MEKTSHKGQKLQQNYLKQTSRSIFISYLT